MGSLRKLGKRWGKQILCIAGGVVIYLILEITTPLTSALEVEGYLKRNSYGEGIAEYELQVEGLWDSEVTIPISLGERIYSAQEAKLVFDQIYEMLQITILGSNSSLEEVRSDLNLVSSLAGYGVKLRWQSEEPSLIDSFGTLYNEEVTENGQEVLLQVQITDGQRLQDREIPIKVYPPSLSEEEKAVAAFRSEVVRLDKADRTKEGIYLPLTYEGKTLSYRDSQESDYKMLLIMGVLLAFLFYAKEGADAKQLVFKRERQMMLDYSEIVSKLMVFIGAGMTIPMAWERIIRDYEAVIKQKGRGERYAYEEMCTTYYQLKSGSSESQAYGEFGRRCRLQPYLKLSSVLEQNRKTGTKNLKAILQIEMAEAFEQRKNLAKRMGEEASTKLLLPLFLMLGIVMVIIVVPAFLSFY